MKSQHDESAQATLTIRIFENLLADQYGASRASADVLAYIRAGALGAIAIERTIRPNGDVWHHLYVALGNEDLTSSSLGRTLPLESELREIAARKASSEIKRRDESRQNAATALAERLRAIEEKGIRRGLKWTSAQAYVQGRKGLTTYDTAKVLDVDESGFVTVECYRRGMRAPERFKIAPDGRLFDSLLNQPQPQPQLSWKPPVDLPVVDPAQGCLLL